MAPFPGAPPCASTVSVSRREAAPAPTPAPMSASASRRVIITWPLGRDDISDPARGRHETLTSIPRFHFNLPAALADVQRRLILSCRTVDDVAVVEGELGAVPRAHHRSFLQRALGQRTS